MTTDAAARAEDDTAAAAPPLLARFDRFAWWFAAIIVLQACWLAGLMASGWFYEADFTNLAVATGRPLNWAYLSQSQGGHLDLLGRVVFWVLNRVDPLNHPLTIALRVLAQGYATFLLGRLLVLLVGRRPGVLFVLALYAASPLLVQSILWLTSSVNFLLSQIFVLWALAAHVRYSLTRELRWAALTGAAMLGATLVSEQSAVAALMLPVLSFGFLHAGGVRQRFAQTLRSWPEWLMVALPIIVFVTFFLGSGKYDNGRLHSGLHGYAVSIWEEWTYCIIPASVGGPWQWFHGRDQYFSLADPSLAIRIGSAVLLAAVIAYSVRRCTGARALIAWSMPFVVSGVGIAVVVVGRFTAFGSVIARQFEHAAYSAVPLAVAAALAFWTTTPDAMRARLGGQPDVPADPPAGRVARRRRTQRFMPITATLLVLAASAVSAVGYAHRWSQGPSERFVATLRNSLKLAGPGVSLFDTYLPTNIEPALAERRKVSDLVRLIDDRVTYNAEQSRVVDAHGRLVPPQFYVATSVDTSGPNAFCNDPISGTEPKPQVLLSRVGANAWFLRIRYFAQYPSIIYVQAVDDHGRYIDPLGGPRVLLPKHLGTAYVPLSISRPASLVVRGATATTRVCITSLAVGIPFPARSGR